MCGDDEFKKLKEELKKKKSLLDEKETSLQEALDKLEEVEETSLRKRKRLGRKRREDSRICISHAAPAGRF